MCKVACGGQAPAAPGTGGRGGGVGVFWGEGGAVDQVVTLEALYSKRVALAWRKAGFGSHDPHQDYKDPTGGLFDHRRLSESPFDCS